MQAGKKRLRFTLPHDEAGAGSVTSFMVAVSVFMIAFSVMTIFVSNYVAKDTNVDDGALEAVANDALELLAKDPGLPPDWYDGCAPERLGLLKSGSETTLDLRKLRKLRDDTGCLAYNDAKVALGVPDHEFHLRSYPVYILDKDGRTGSLENYRAAYVGDYTGAVESSASRQESGAISELGLTFKNATVNSTGNPLDSGDKYRDGDRFLAAHLPIRLAGLLYNEDDVSTESAGLFDDTHWQLVDTHNTSIVGKDPDHRNVLTPSEHSSGSWAYQDGADDRVIVARVDLTDYDGAAWVNFSHYASGNAVDPGLGLPLVYYDYGVVEVADTDSVLGGTPLSNLEWTAVTNDKLWNEGEDTNYTQASYSLDAWLGEDVLLAFRWHTEVEVPLAKGDGWFIGNVTVEATGSTGNATLVDNTFDYTDTPYDVIVVGSNVNQTTLEGDDNEVSSAITQWVEAGGDVVAFGSDELDSAWLSRFVGSSPGTSNGPLLLGQSDPSHPILNSPHNLNYFSWPASDRTYGVTAADTRFTQVLVREGGASGPETVLAATNPNSEYDGTLAVTSYRPYDLSSENRLQLMENTLLYTRFNDLYLDYGPPMPSGESVSSSDHAGLVDTQDLGLGVLDYRLVLYVWK